MTTTSPAERAFRIGIVGNFFLAALKLGVGMLAGSRALIADGWHSFADVVVNVLAWAAHRFSLVEPDEDHHYGHGKLEAFAGLGVGLMLIGAGIGVGISAFASRIALESGWRLGLALGVAVLSIAGNIVLARIATGGSKASGSPGLKALARDNGSDALSDTLVLFALIGAAFGVTWAEPVATLAIGVLIAVMGWRSTRDGFDVLMDRTDPELRRQLKALASAEAAVRGVQSVRIRPLGGSLIVDMEISVDGELSVKDSHRIAHSVESAVTGAHPSVREVHVHVNPATPTD